MENRAELLVESVISIFILTMCLIPISSSINSSIKIDKKIFEKTIFNNNCKNALNEMLAFDYDKIINFEIQKNFLNIKELIEYFDLTEIYYKEIEGNLEVQIRKTGYFLGDKNIYYIKVGEYEEYYIPK